MGKLLGTRIKEIRLKKGMSQQQFATSLGYSHKSVINKIENGQKEMSYQKILLLIKEYALDANMFLDINDIDNIDAFINADIENSKKEKCIIYIHGLNGSNKESEFYNFLNHSYDIIGLDYQDGNPWEIKDIIIAEVKEISKQYKEINIIANSIGAFYAIHYLSNFKIKKSLFISPLVNMKEIIESIMHDFHISFKEFEEKKEIRLQNGQTLSYSFYNEVVNKKVQWKSETTIVYGKNDSLVNHEKILEFSACTQSSLFVCKNGEHWFHKPNQMKFLKSVVNKTFA